MIKKFLAAGVIATVLVIGLGLTVQAHSDNQEKAAKLAEKIKKLDLDDDDLPDVEKASPQPNPSLFIGPKGNVRIIAGTVTGYTEDLAQSRVTVEVWKIKLDVNRSGARLIPENGQSTSTPSAVKIGDRVSVKGTINAETGIVNASIFHNLSQRENKSLDIQKKIAELLKKLNELRAKINLPPINL